MDYILLFSPVSIKYNHGVMANFILVGVNTTILLVSALVGEYEVAKLTHPAVSWIPSPSGLSLTLVGLASLVAIVNLAVLIFVIMRRLPHHRRWLWWTTTVGMILVLGLVMVYGTNFMQVLWPTP